MSENIMNTLEDNLMGFRTIELGGLDTIRLMKRFDTKFVFCREILPYVFDCLVRDYSVLQINDKRAFAYQTLYYDTDNYFFYHQHHDQRVNRHKIRCRRYLDTEQCYVEVKCKNNKKKMVKNRLLLHDKHIQPELSETAKAFAKSCLGNGNNHIVDRVKPVLWVTYDRITFANPINMERITFDLNLGYTDNCRALLLDHLVIAELKQPRFLFKSDFFLLLKNLNIFPIKFSKYCMGIALMEKGIKTNRFKKNILQLKKSGFISCDDQSGDTPQHVEGVVENRRSAYEDSLRA